MAIDWDEELRHRSVSYTGEEVYSAQGIELDRLVPQLPPEDLAAAVDICDLLP